ncbi:MAG: hypothetical protein QF921_08455 [Pseudomonadales bacterium]|jgi:hypothetical protein|nr:hypothetical protein [Pseudomonadales bacterium]
MELEAINPAELATLVPLLRDWIAAGCPADYPACPNLAEWVVSKQKIPASPGGDMPLLLTGDPAEVVPKAQTILAAMEALT